jgi:hypothetical protein
MPKKGEFLKSQQDDPSSRLRTHGGQSIDLDRDTPQPWRCSSPAACAILLVVPVAVWGRSRGRAHEQPRPGGGALDDGDVAGRGQFVRAAAQTCGLGLFVRLPPSVFYTRFWDRPFVRGYLVSSTTFWVWLLVWLEFRIDDDVQSCGIPVRSSCCCWRSWATGRKKRTLWLCK